MSNPSVGRTRQGRDEAILRYHDFGDSNREIARRIGCDEGTVRHVLKLAEITEVLAGVSGIEEIEDSVLLQIARLERRWWEPAARAAKRQYWTVDEMKQIVRRLKDSRQSDAEKLQFLEAQRGQDPAYAIWARRMDDAMSEINDLLRSQPAHVAETLTPTHSVT